ncbi:hypothetical protein GCWU000342_01374 [Shuttleworthella satelles DSM 14600]|uniref:Uncharacterized protein n=1 Tax=Shuttleworthella satelles DSM 14600 TaxID=626523 RepID=C4GBS1_9FIRM|nr:hypothetical protein GCWU000342_01374 [Shuttleworthia satelles DSM 14600]
MISCTGEYQFRESFLPLRDDSCFYAIIYSDERNLWRKKR